MPELIADNRKTCSLLRRLGAIFYDGLLLFSLLFFSTLLILPFNSGAAIDSGNIPYKIYLLAISYFYFTWQWTHGGQTLGMLAWKIRLEGKDCPQVGWMNATIRLLLAVISLVFFGAGFLWSVFDSGKLAFHDRFSDTRLILVTG
jgi:uncharacterized RDD family membrane protein YckC